MVSSGHFAVCELRKSDIIYERNRQSYLLKILRLTGLLL